VKYFVLTALIFNAIFITPANADETIREFQAIVRVASLCEDFKEHGFKSAIITQEEPEEYEPIQEYASSKNLTLSVFNISELQNIQADLIIISTSVTLENQHKIKDYFKDKNVITASADLKCVKEGRCMLGVEDKNALKILLNGDLYKQSKLKFDRSFKFMVKEI
jgi:hypothetical protein